jgi:ABC-type antimicrobial peptide transport system permease subunit
MALMALAVVVFTAVTGYVTYLLFFADRSRGEMDLLRSMGAQQRQIIGLLALEHLVIVLVGMGLGALAGLQMSALTVPTVSLTESSGSALPPMLITADWWAVAVVCLALVSSFVEMLLVLKRRIFRSDLHDISRRVER